MSRWLKVAIGALVAVALGGLILMAVAGFHAALEILVTVVVLVGLVILGANMRSSR
jgi:hypothetical protein